MGSRTVTKRIYAKFWRCLEEKVAGCQYGEEFCLENGNSGAKQKGVFFNDVFTVVDEPGPAILF